MNNFWRKTKKPIKVLAPMAGYTDAAFRLLARNFGTDVVFSELVSADAIAHAKLKIKSRRCKINKKELIFNEVLSDKRNSTARLLSFFEEERPFVVQLFGKYPEKFGLATKWISEVLKPDGIDINMGCPARKVVGSDHGAALLKNYDLAVKIVKEVKKNTPLPVSVKTRLGWSCDDEIIKFVPKLVEAGVDAIIIHGRTYNDGFKGVARWNNIYKIKDIVGDDLVVIGNGDIKKTSDKLFELRALGSKYVLDGVAVGRAMFGTPWFFSDKKRDIKEIITLHAQLSFETKGEKGIIEFRKHLLAYLKSFAEAKKIRTEAVKVVNISDVKKVLSMF